MKITNLAIIFLLVIAIALGIFAIIINKEKEQLATVPDFEQCAALGYPVLETYPRQCKTPDGQTFVEDIGNAIEKQNLIRVTAPKPNDHITSPLTITGEARGTWFFEAVFPIKIIDANGNQLGTAQAQAQAPWMTEDFVPFTATLVFQTPTTAKGTLILEKDNPSGLTQNSDELLVPVYFNK
ncbi:MAG: Gmad2 immunoglobulin-like domain-containing protein [Candidatus Pacebacteria bacterium]|nr:Gmad2 immunoglobulin-like domain-containing protein [Candidatus Paceibacterota bacterium]